MVWKVQGAQKIEAIRGAAPRCQAVPLEGKAKRKEGEEGEERRGERKERGKKGKKEKGRKKEKKEGRGKKKEK
eukprot:Skav228267  [mRNA]  locus=scaffold778:94657:94875:+ [translate_table: standard]